MSRKYQDTETFFSLRRVRKLDGSFTTIKKQITRTTDRKGLKFVHIGEDVWRIGIHKVSGGNKHQVIYGPGNKEYHLYGTDVDFVNDRNVYKSCKRAYIPSRVNRNGNISLESRVKIYILTHILDQKENWSFDLSIVPPVGKLKVIYANGTVKNIDFDGEFKDTFIRYGWVEKGSADAEKMGNMIPAFGYRIPK
jgi:hypothetical protein